MRDPISRNTQLRVTQAFVPDARRRSDEPAERHPLAIRGAERALSGDPAIWLQSDQVCQTEVSLRLAMYLLAQGKTKGDVHVALTGNELTRRSQPQFPVRQFLAERGFARYSHDEGWSGAYKTSSGTFALHVGDDQSAPDVVATLTTGRRLIAHVSRGLIKSTRSPAEHKLLRSAIARAVTCDIAETYDIIAAAVPRSKRFRELAVRWRGAEGVARANVLILTVDRAGTVDGLPRE